VTEGGEERRKKKETERPENGTDEGTKRRTMVANNLPSRATRALRTIAMRSRDNSRQWTYFDDVTCKQVGAIFGRRGYAA
jgi:hypothetical protein